jgi:DNA invertase Pin-like site-specific DNA recombinase
MKTKIYSYIRFSSTSQADGQSVDRQLDIAKQYAKKVAGVYQNKSFSDMGVSGWSGKKRDGLELMFEMVESKTIKAGSHIVIERLDRLSRAGIAETQRLITTIVQHGVFLYVAADNLLLDHSSINDLVCVIRVAVAADLACKESEQKSQRIKAAKMAKKAAGLDGKATKRAVPFWLQFNESKSIYEFSDKLSIAKRIIELRQQGLGETKIAQHLNNEDIKPMRAVKWLGVAVSNVFKSPALFGAWQTQTQINGKYVNSDLIENQYPALVTYQEFLLMNPKTKTARGKDSGLNAFKGLLKCAKCGSIMARHTFKNYDGSQYVGFRCNDAGKNLGCKAVGYRDLDKTLFKAVSHLKVIKTQQTDDGAEIRQLESKLSQIQQMILSSDDITALIQTSTVIEKQLKTAKAKQKPSSDVTVEQLSECINEPRKFNLLARNLIKSIVVDVKPLSRVKKTLHVKVNQHNGHTVNMTVLSNGQTFINDTKNLDGLIEQGDYEIHEDYFNEQIAEIQKIQKELK